jgi:hypothetical protein
MSKGTGGDARSEEDIAKGLEEAQKALDAEKVAPDV